MKLRNRILTCALAALTALGGIVSAAASAQTSPAPTPVKGRDTLATFVIYRDASGNVACRVATPAEHRRIMDARSGDGSRIIYKGAPRTRTAAGIVENYSTEDPPSASAATSSGSLPALLPSAGLHIFLHATSQLAANTQARDAFIVAANRWEALISTPINVVIDADFGPNFFGAAYTSTNILGQTGSRQISTSFSNVRQRLINTSPTAAELQIYNALPASTVPVEGANGTSTTLSSVVMTRANARAVGLVADIDGNSTTADARIGFNSNFGNSTGSFDFNPDDGITPGATDFDAVVTHEIGHALGFVSDSGETSPTALAVWDVFRFRPGAASLGTMATAQRVMAKGGTQVYFNNQASTVPATSGQLELGLSTGGPEPSAGDGDGRQSSHWKDDFVGGVHGPYIGIMDPTIGSNVRRQITDNDVKAIDSFGWSVGGTVPPPPPPPPGPANDKFANAIALTGAAGGVTGNNANAMLEAGEPPHASFPGGASVWYNWTSPTTGTATFDTIGSNYDTTLAAYTGPSVGALSLLAENDDLVSAQNVVSRITFPTQAGTTYRIQVDGYDGSTGSFQLNWTSSGTTPTPTPVSFSVSGRVVDPDGSPLANVQISLDGPNLTNGFPALPTTTDANGNYQFTLLTGGGNYSVRPSDTRYNFGGGPYVFNSISFNQTGVNFTATAPASITGTASIVGTTNLLPGVTVTVNGFNPTRVLKQTKTDATGHWTVTGLTLGQTYSFVFSKAGYTFDPPAFSGVLSSTPYNIGNVIATPPANKIDTSEFFVAQHYRDFLGREPDADGLAFWVNQIESCGTNAGCIGVRRVNVSAAFFLSIEFQETGYLVERMFKTAYGDVLEPSTGLTVPVIRRAEFIADTPLIGNNVIVGVGNWQAQLEANKTAYAQAFVQRARFTTAFPASMTAAQFVDQLFANARVTPTAAERDTAIAAFGTGDVVGRAAALRSVAQSSSVDKAEKNRAYVLMEYYGYLRRNPNDAPEANLNFAGWNFWLTKLNQFNGDAVRAEMVKAFLDASEYRSRFN